MVKDYLITGIFPLTLAILTAGLISGCLSSDRFKGSLKQQYQVEIIRDTWGVPHIFGQTDADTAYGLAYASAEDDFETIQMVFLASRGKLGAVMGKEMAPLDYAVQLLKVRETVEAKYKTLSPEFRAVCEAYADGLNCYAATHQDQLLYRKVWPVEGKDLVAGFVQKLPLFFGLEGTLKRIFNNRVQPASPKVGQLPFEQRVIGSNFLAVGPERSADGATRVAVNSHQPWSGPVAWYEAHLISQEGQDVYGGLFPGSPIIFLGHNRNLAWGHTVNEPDLIDVFELEINPKNPNQYRFDGKWKNLEVRKVPIEVKIWKNFRWTVKREALWSVYGPAMRNEKGVFAIRYAGIGNIKAIEQWYRMGKAKNLAEFKQAMKIHAIPMFNTGYADKEGHLYYVYNGLLPQRNPNYDWTQTVPGNTSETLWQGYLPYDDLPQVEDPSAAFIHSCNSSPFKATLGEDNPDPKKYPAYLGIETFMTNRSRRARALFGTDPEISRQDFFDYKFDKEYDPASRLIGHIDRFLQKIEPENAEQKQAMELIRSWDRKTDLENRSTAMVTLTFRPRSQTGKMRYDKDRFLRQMKEAILMLKQRHSRIDPTWGEVNRLVRGKVDLPLAGGHDVLRAIYGEISDGRLVGVAGDCFFQIVEWDKNGNQQAWVINQYGSNPSQPDSPHYADQAELFAQEKMRPAWLTREQILANAERRYRPTP